MGQNSWNEPKPEQGFYIDGDGNIVAWWNGVLLVYPDFYGSSYWIKEVKDGQD